MCVSYELLAADLPPCASKFSLLSSVLPMYETRRPTWTFQETACKSVCVDMEGAREWWVRVVVARQRLERFAESRVTSAPDRAYILAKALGL